MSHYTAGVSYHRGTVARQHVINRQVETLRRKLPANQYLYLLHQAATTGFMPTLDEAGDPQPIPADTPMLTPMQRVPIVQCLLDKVMPDAKYDHEPEVLEAASVRVEEIGELPSEKLARLMLKPDVHTVPAQ